MTRSTIAALVVSLCTVATPFAVGAQSHPRRAGIERRVDPRTMRTPSDDWTRQDGMAEAHFRLASMHRAEAMDQLRVLHDYADGRAANFHRLDRDLVLEHVGAVSEHLTAAQRHQTAEESALTYFQRRSNHDQLEEIRAATADAVRESGILSAEANRRSPDARAIAEHAAATYHALRRAQAAHEALGVNVGLNVEAAVPPQREPTPVPRDYERRYH